ncbi:MAG: hypothetical protein ABSH13_03255 [Candidatus Acidiferrum sp.]|jgi:hypothetical protein
MKLQNIVRVPMIVMGLGVALLLASPLRAQQEINPDTFDINPGTPKAELVAATPASAGPASASDASQSVPVSQAAVVSGADWNGMFAAPLNAVDVTMVLILAIGTGLVAIYTIAATRRQRRFSPARSGVHTSTSGATTH